MKYDKNLIIIDLVFMKIKIQLLDLIFFLTIKNY